uniref:Putative group i salivary lipocalin n=1 Tax=Rhipicephalus pulchellus TaxID=72859 RepID=L7LQ93_RHIPC
MRDLTFFLLFVLLVDVHGASLKDLYDALNTNKTIWLYKQCYEDNSEATGHTCVRWHKKNLTTSSYVFDYDYKKDGEYPTDYNTTATLSFVNEAATMNVNYTREGRGSTIVSYTLSFWNDIQKCFVLIRNTDNADKVQYELHLWGSPLHGDHSVCDTKYNNLCVNKEQPEVFTEDKCM